MYSAINNCTTIKQVLDNAATWQQMVKNNLIVYCIEQSDDFMKTLVDYPDRLYEFLRSEYALKLMTRSNRCSICSKNSLDKDGPSKGIFIPIKSSPKESGYSSQLYISGKYVDGSRFNYRGDDINKIVDIYFKSKKLIAEFRFGMVNHGESEIYEVYLYSPTKPTI